MSGWLQSAMPISTLRGDVLVVLDARTRRARRGNAGSARAPRCSRRRSPGHDGASSITMSRFWSEPDRIVCALGRPRLLDRDLECALALVERHREELALLAGDEQAVDREIVDPMADVAPQAGLVDGEVARPERRVRPPPRCRAYAGANRPWRRACGISSVPSDRCGVTACSLRQTGRRRKCAPAARMKRDSG